MPSKPPGVTPFLMFPKDGAKAVERYRAAFGKDAETVALATDGDRLLHAHLRLKGQDLLAMDGGPTFGFAEGLSLFVRCKDQAEVDHYWDALSKGGEKGQCGWLKDAWGVSWQIIPEAFLELTSKGTPQQTQAVFAAMMGMRKLVVKDLQKAFDAAA